jgi:uncharacterized protein (DUF697 family)
VSPGRGSAAPRVLAALPGLVREVHAEDSQEPILLSGPPSAALELEQLLTAGGERAAVRRVSVLELDDPDLAESPVLVYVIKGGITPTDERALRTADRRSLPAVCLLVDAPYARDVILPYIAATDVVRADALGPEVVDHLARRLAARSPDAAAPLARRLPALRDGVCETIVEGYAKRTAAFGALSGRASGPDLPAMTLLEIRMGLLLTSAYGRNVPPLQLGTAVAALGGGYALRGLSRTLAAVLPLPGWLVRAAVAYGGARVLGAAAVLLAQKAPVGADRAR